MILLLSLLACGLPDCDAFCAERADCVEAEIESAGSSWDAWTGQSDRRAYEEACRDEFYRSVEDGGEADDVQSLCRAEDACG